jgi:Ring finger domain
VSPPDKIYPCTMESLIFLPVLLTPSVAFAACIAEITMDSSNSLSFRSSNMNENNRATTMEEYSEEYLTAGTDNAKIASDTHIEVQFNSCDNEVYLFKEWTSSTGLLCSILLMYIGLVTITNVIVVYKFIATWNQITVSLREQNRVCTKYANVPSTRRQTCHEALKPSRYNCDECDTLAPCPICLLDVQNQDIVVSCEEGCGTKYHKNCLYNWLDFKGNNDELIGDNHTSCPCCRKELLGIVSSKPTTNCTSGFVTEMSTLVGYYPC